MDEPLNLQSLTFKKNDKASLMDWLKTVYLIGLTVFFFAGTAFLMKLFLEEQIENKNDVVLTTGYRIDSWQGFGEVFEPVVKLAVLYPQGGSGKEEFLLDSGALISSMPREKAEEFGFSLAKLPRALFFGFGGTTAFAYKADLKVQLGDEEVVLPVVFTEAAGTKPLLGRSGFFDNYSICFDSKGKTIEIKR